MTQGQSNAETGAPPGDPEGGLLPARTGLARWVDYRMGVAGAFFLAAVVFAINVNHGVLGATTAALKQGTYTFFAGGFVMRTAERLSVRYERRLLGLAAGTLVPSTIAIGATLLIHHLKGTPHPIASTVPTMVMAPPSFFVWGWRKRNQARLDAETGE